MPVKKSLEEKVESYKLFWNRENTKRPIIGFDVGGYFPLQSFTSLRGLQPGDELVPELIKPEECLEDYERIQVTSASVTDDFIRGVSPLTAFPWMEAMLGCTAKLAEESIWAVERRASLEELERVCVKDDNPWLVKYLEFVTALVRQAAGKYPVGQPILRGVTDIIGALRGHDQALIDGLENPQRIRELCERCARAIVKVLNRQFEIVEPFMGGYIVEQYSLWAPDRIARLQEDASSIYSPELYLGLIQENDRLIASSFPLSVVHLHSSSLFLLTHFLEIEEIDVFQVNRDVGGMDLTEMLPYLHKIQESKRCLIVRGTLTQRDLRPIKESLRSEGLLIQIVVNGCEEAEELQDVIGKLW